MIWVMILLASLRRINDLINWNWNSNIEFKLIAKIFVLNELNFLLNLRRNRLLIDQLIERKKNIFVCMQFKFFLNCFSAFSSKYCFLNNRIFRVMFIFWKYWNDVFECIKKNVMNMTWETSSRKILARKKNFDLMIWIIDDFNVLIIQYWLIWFNCYCCNWDDQKCI